MGRYEGTIREITPEGKLVVRFGDKGDYISVRQKRISHIDIPYSLMEQRLPEWAKEHPLNEELIGTKIQISQRFIEKQLAKQTPKREEDEFEKFLESLPED